MNDPKIDVFRDLTDEDRRFRATIFADEGEFHGIGVTPAIAISEASSAWQSASLFAAMYSALHKAQVAIAYEEGLFAGGYEPSWEIDLPHATLAQANGALLGLHDGDLIDWCRAFGRREFVAFPYPVNATALRLADDALSLWWKETKRAAIGR